MHTNTMVSCCRSFIKDQPPAAKKGSGPSRKGKTCPSKKGKACPSKKGKACPSRKGKACPSRKGEPSNKERPKKKRLSTGSRRALDSVRKAFPKIGANKRAKSRPEPEQGLKHTLKNLSTNYPF